MHTSQNAQNKSRFKFSGINEIDTYLSMDNENCDSTYSKGKFGKTEARYWPNCTKMV